METKERNKRPDRQKKLQDRKHQIETVVKSALLKHLHGDGATKARIRDAIQERVEAYSRRVNMASIVLSGIIKESFHKVDDVLSVFLPDVTDQTFIRQILLGTEEAQVPIVIIKSYYERHPECIKTTERHLMDRNIYSAGAISYSTNIKNGLKLNLGGRIKKFTKQYGILHGLSPQESVAMYFRINAWPLPSGLGCIFPEREVVSETISQHRRVLGLEEDQCISKMWIKATTSIDKMVRYYVFLNRFNEENGLPMFNIVPMCRMGAHFITIDTHTLYGLMKEVGLVSDMPMKTFVDLGQDQWASFFKISQLESNSNKFTGTIETDGISVCTHFMRPMSEHDIFQRDMEPISGGKTTKKRKIQSSDSVGLNPEDRVVGIDPGRSNIIFAVEQNEDGSFKRWILTRKRYYADAGIYSARRKTKTWSESIHGSLEAMSNVSTKGVNLIHHQDFLDVYMENYDSLWGEYMKSRWARQRLRLYGGKKRVFANFFQDIKNYNPDRRVVIAYGSAQFAPGGKGEISVPTSRAYAECSMRLPTLVVDEFRSTRVHHEDGTLLEGVQRRDTNERLRGLLWCSSTNNTKFVNRDLNAAINIRRCVTNPVRPLELTRIKGQNPLPRMGIGKIIKC